MLSPPSSCLSPACAALNAGGEGVLGGDGISASGHKKSADPVCMQNQRSQPCVTPALAGARDADMPFFVVVRWPEGPTAFSLLHRLQLNCYSLAQSQALVTANRLGANTAHILDGPVAGPVVSGDESPGARKGDSTAPGPGRWTLVSGIPRL